MIYIIEGVDNSGKDTVIRELIKALPNQPHIIHCVGIRRETKAKTISASRMYYAQMFDLLKYATNMLHVDVILNRSHIGDYVYGQIYRDYTVQEAEYIYDLERNTNIVAKGIYVKANPDTLIERDDGLSQSHNDKFKIIKELHLFNAAIKKSKFDFSVIDTSHDPDTPSILKELIKK